MEKKLKYLFPFLLFFIAFTVSAQDTHHTVKAGAALGFMELGLDGDNPMLYFQYNYRFYKRLELSSTISFVNQSRRDDEDAPASLRSHVMADLSLNLSLIRSRSHTLKAGGGLTVRRRTELVAYRWDYVRTRDPQHVAYYTYTRAKDLGYCINVEYDYNISKRVLAGTRFAYYQYPEGGYFFFLGLNVGVRF